MNIYITLRLGTLIAALAWCHVLAIHARNNEHEALEKIVGSGLSHLYTLRHPKLDPEQFRFLRENDITRQVVEQSFVEIAEEIATEKEIQRAMPHLEILKVHFPELRIPIEEYEESYGRKKEITQIVAAIAKNPGLATIIKNVGIGVAVIWFLRRILGTARDSVNNEKEEYAHGLTNKVQRSCDKLDATERSLQNAEENIMPLLGVILARVRNLEGNLSTQGAQMHGIADLGKSVVDNTEAMVKRNDELLEAATQELESNGTLSRGVGAALKQAFLRKQKESSMMHDSASTSQPQSPLLSRRSSLQSSSSPQVLSLEDYSNDFYGNHGTGQSNQTVTFGKRQVRKNSVGSNPSSSSTKARATHSGSSSGSTRKRGMRRAASLITLPFHSTGSAPPSPATISDGSD